MIIQHDFDTLVKEYSQKTGNNKPKWVLPTRKGPEKFHQLFNEYIKWSGFLTWMKPEELMKMYPAKGDLEHYDIDSFKNIKSRLEKGLPLDPLYLIFDDNNCKTLNHEGRHRLIIAALLRIQKVPVLMKFTKDDIGSDITTEKPKCCEYDNLEMFDKFYTDHRGEDIGLYKAENVKCPNIKLDPTLTPLSITFNNEFETSL